MNRLEIRNSLVLSAIFALRMLGLFIILPVFSIYAQSLPGNISPSMVGWVMGIYGLVQACLHIPLGMLSDRIGRKPVIVGGLILFIAGGLVAALSDSLAGIALGRAIQGAGAISAAITAMVADLTREAHRSKAMAMIGGSIGLAFAVSLVIAAPLYQHIGMQGIFWLMSLLGGGAILLVLFLLPNTHLQQSSSAMAEKLAFVLKKTDLWCFNFGVLVLHAVQMAMFIVVPHLLINLDLPVAEHWQIYLPVILGSFLLMLAPMLAAERAGKTHILLISAIALLFLVQILFGIYLHHQISLVIVGLLLLSFFTGFNLLEAMQPTLISRLAAQAKGTALGVYNTMQALGLFAGGALGGIILKLWGTSAVFFACSALLLVWLIIASGIQPIRSRQPITTTDDDIS